jgi:hypothetical protein
MRHIISYNQGPLSVRVGDDLAHLPEQISEPAARISECHLSPQLPAAPAWSSETLIRGALTSRRSLCSSLRPAELAATVAISHKPRNLFNYSEHS